MKNHSLIISIASCIILNQAHAIEPVYEGENGIRAKVFETNCLACHSSQLTGADRNRAPVGADYDTYSAAVAHGTPAVNRGVIQMNMPPSFSPLSTLDEEQKQALKNWQTLGFPEKKLPTIYSASTQELSLPHVYLKDENGDISLKWQVKMKLIPNQQNIQFELTDFDEIDESSESSAGHAHK